jgi:hypothetical protein
VKPRLRRSFALLPSPVLALLIVIVLVLVLVIDLQSWPTRSWGITLSGEAQREAPAQAELRPPTFARARASYRIRARARPRYRSSIVAGTVMGDNIVRRGTA